MGAYVSGSNQALTLPGYDTFDGSLAYDFGHFQVKLQGFNLLDKRATTGYTCATNSGTSTCVTGTALNTASDEGLYTFQSGRELSLTLSAKLF